MREPWAVRTRAVAIPAWESLRMYWGTALLLLVVVSTAVGAILPVVSLQAPEATDFATRLRLPDVSGPAGGLEWSGPVRTPAAIQREAVGVLFHLLLAVAFATATAGAITVLTLFAARASQRSSEIRVRRAVGASRRAVLAATLWEAAAIGFAALLSGAAIGAVAAHATLADWPGLVGPAALSPRLMVLSGAVVALLLAAALPLVFAREGPIVGPPAKPLQLALPAIQLGLGLIALTAGALVSRRATELSVTGAHPAEAGKVYPLATAGLPSADRGRRYADLLDMLRQQPEFDTISLTSPGALVGLGTVSVVTTDCGTCRQGGLSLKWHLESATHQFVSADSFQALGVHLIAGRGIGAQDRWDAPHVAVVSRGLAIRHFQKGEAIGRQMLVGDDVRTWHTVVGIVDDPPVSGFGGGLLPPFTVYLSVLQHPVSSAELLVRASPRAAVQAAVAAAVQKALGSSTLLPAPQGEREILAAQQAPLRWFARWFGIQGWVILGLSAAGVYALMRLWVLSLSSELGLRRAVGARRRQILGLVLGQAAKVGFAGVAIGMWFGPPAWDAMRSAITGLPAWNPEAVTRYAVLLVGICAAGAWLPAWRAARTDPARLLAGGES